jgi:hypothetical protein
MNNAHVPWVVFPQTRRTVRDDALFSCMIHRVHTQGPAAMLNMQCTMCQLWQQCAARVPPHLHPYQTMLQPASTHVPACHQSTYCSCKGCTHVTPAGCSSAAAHHPSHHDLQVRHVLITALPLIIILILVTLLITLVALILIILILITRLMLILAIQRQQALPLLMTLLSQLLVDGTGQLVQLQVSLLQGIRLLQGVTLRCLFCCWCRCWLWRWR